MERLDLAEQFEDLRTISDMVAEYLTRELFREEWGSDGDYGANEILARCYSFVEEELKEYGVYFRIPDTDLLGDFYTAKHIYYIRQLLDATNLITTLKDATTIDEISTLDISVNHDEGFAFLIDLLIRSQPSTTLTLLQDFANTVRVTSEFYDHIHACCNYVKDNGLDVALPDLSKATAYLNKIKVDRERIAQFASTVMDNSVTIRAKIDKLILNKLITDYDIDKIDASALKIYSYLDNGEVAEPLQAYKDLKLLEHHRRSPHHIEYWEIRPTTVFTYANALICIGHLWETDVALEDLAVKVHEFMNKLDKLVITYPDTKEDMMEFIKLVTQVFITEMRK